MPKFVYIFLLLPIIFLAQVKWEYSSPMRVEKVSFSLSNNNVLLPIKLNGVTLNFVLDTGSPVNILFNIPEKDSLVLKKSRDVKITGPGLKEPLKAFITEENRVEIGKMKTSNFDLIILEEGTQEVISNSNSNIHGIIGADFFKDNLVEINYVSKKIKFTPAENQSFIKKYRNTKKLDFDLIASKPFIDVSLTIDNSKEEKLKMLIDTGLSDGIWLFDKSELSLERKNIEDYLGASLGGDIYGNKSRFNKFKFFDFEFEKPIISFPDTIYFSLKKINSRVNDGSIGGEILKRFKVLFDYRNKTIYLQKNQNYNNPFRYNIAGIDLIVSGYEIFEEKEYIVSNGYNNFSKEKSTTSTNNFVFQDSQNFRLNFKQKPKYIIHNIRKNSVAEKVGLLKGDKILSINGLQYANTNLEKYANLFYGEKGEYLKMEIERKGIKMNFELHLEDEL